MRSKDPLPGPAGAAELAGGAWDFLRTECLSAHSHYPQCPVHTQWIRLYTLLDRGGSAAYFTKRNVSSPLGESPIQTLEGNPASDTRPVKPIVPYLVLPESPDEKPHLKGARCMNCGTTYLAPRLACSKCFERNLEEVRLSDHGDVYVYTIVHQSLPGIKTPYVVAVVDLPEGCSVNATIIDVEPRAEAIKFGMHVEMVTRPVSVDRAGNQVVSFFFRPAVSR